MASKQQSSKSRRFTTPKSLRQRPVGNQSNGGGGTALDFLSSTSSSGRRLRSSKSSNKPTTIKRKSNNNTNDLFHSSAITNKSPNKSTNRKRNLRSTSVPTDAGGDGSAAAAKAQRQSDDSKEVWIEFPLGPEGDKRKVSVPEQLASWQAIVDTSNNPYGSLQFLSKTMRTMNGGSPPMILDALMLDNNIKNVALLQETGLRNSEKDCGIIVVGLPAIVRSLPSFQTERWKDAAPGELCAEWNRRVNMFDIDITTLGVSGKASLNIDWMKQHYIYRSSFFTRGNSDAISKMVGSMDNWTAYDRPTCKHPGGCTKEGVKRGFCKQHLPKKCPFCEKNNAGGSANFECRSCNMRRRNKVYSHGSLLTEKQLKEMGIWNPNPGTLTKELAQKEAKKVAKK